MKYHQLYLSRLAMTLLLIMMTFAAWAQSTAYVSTYGELKTAIENVSVNNIIVTANINVPCALQNRFFKMNFPDLVQTGLKDKTFNF